LLKQKNKLCEKDLVPTIVKESLTQENKTNPINGYSINIGSGLQDAFATLQHITICPECKSRWQNILKCAQTFKNCQVNP